GVQWKPPVFCPVARLSECCAQTIRGRFVLQITLLRWLVLNSVDGYRTCFQNVIQTIHSTIAVRSQGSGPFYFRALGTGSEDAAPVTRGCACSRRRRENGLAHVHDAQAWFRPPGSSQQLGRPR